MTMTFPANSTKCMITATRVQEARPERTVSKMDPQGNYDPLDEYLQKQREKVELDDAKKIN